LRSETTKSRLEYLAKKHGTWPNKFKHFPFTDEENRLMREGCK